MSWQDILKDDRQDELQELLISFREFTPIREITKEEEEKVLSMKQHKNSRFDKTPAFKRTLEFMKPFDEIKRDGLDFVFKFDIDGVPFTFKMPFLHSPLGSLELYRAGIGEKAYDTFPIMDSTGMSFCLKANSTMTNGDFMVTVLLASKNNQLPTILTLPAYVEKHYPNFKMHERGGQLFDIDEEVYKKGLLENFYKLVEDLSLEDRPLTRKISFGKLNNELKEYIPKELLGSW